MKLPTSKQLEGHDAATWRGAIEGTLGGLAVSVPASFWAHRRFAGYRALPPSLKALGVITVVAPAFAIQAERRGLQYDRSQWTEEERRGIEAEKARQAIPTDASSGDRFKRWAADNKFSIIAGTWATSMTVAGSLIMRDRLQTFPQKIVQIRMWAQGITILTLIATAAVTAGADKDKKVAAQADHSWQRMLEKQAEENKAWGALSKKPLIHRPQEKQAEAQ